jgi:Tol biopolymer transport system component
MKHTFFTVILLLILLAGSASAEQVVRLEAAQQLKTATMDILATTWSPDGTTLALTQAKHTGIYLMDPVTGAVTTVTEETPAGYRFSWSPDERSIAYKALVDAQAIRKAVKIADLETGQIRQISGLSADVGVPAWFPDGRIGYTYEGNFLVVDEEGTITETIPGIASNVAAISSDGQWILYNDTQDRMWTYHLGDGERFQATPDGRRFFNPVWSPAEPVAIVNELGGPFHLLDIADGTLTELDHGNHYAWSPDGAQIVYDITADDGHYITAADLYVINKDGSAKTTLTMSTENLEMFPSWSPQGRIAFSQPDGHAFIAQMQWQ